MELLNHVNTQLFFPVAAVTVVLICAALVFVFGFHSAEQPQFDKLPLVLDDRKSSNKRRKTKEKKSSPNRTSAEDSKAKSEVSKKSPVKEKKEEKVKEPEKPKEKPTEIRVVKKETTADVKKGKKNKAATETEKPVDFDDAGWQEVPKKSEKKKVKTSDEKEKDKKESPAKKIKKKTKEVEIEPPQIVDDAPQEISKVENPEDLEADEDAATALLAKVKEFQRVLREAERREQEALGGVVEEEEVPAVEELTDVKDLRSNKKKENKEKQIKKKANEAAALTKAAAKLEPAEKDRVSESSEKQDEKNTPVFDELGDTWTDAKAAKKGKKKARKDQ